MGSEINSKKRVLFIITQSGEGGAQRFLYNLISRIAGRYDIRVATGSEGGKELLDKLSGMNIEVSVLKHLKREISPKNDIRTCLEIRALINDYQPNSLFLLSSKAGFIGSLATIFPSKIKNLRVIYRIGGWTFNDPWPKWKKKLWIQLEKTGARWKDIIIVNNKHDLNQADKLKIKPRGELILIPNGIDPYKLDLLPRDEARVRLFEKLARYSGKIFQAENIIGTIANFYPAKGLEFLIETAEYFKNNDNLIFIIIGEGKERGNLEKMIKEKGLDKKVFLTGGIANAYRFMSSFDLFVLPSVKEGFPWTLIEAMAAKVPVVATRVGGVPDIIDNGKNGFIVEPKNPAALASKIKEILSNDRLSQEFSIQGHQTVLFNFSEDKMIRGIEDLL